MQCQQSIIKVIR